MRTKLKWTVVAFLALSSGLLAHSKLHAKLHKNTPPDPKPRFARVGTASWYSERSPGIRKRTASNEIFDDRAMTAAMWGVPFDQRVKVTNLDNGKTIIVRVNDRGPHRRYVRRGRVIDLTKNAFEKIGVLKNGLINVEVEFL